MYGLNKISVLKYSITNCIGLLDFAKISNILSDIYDNIKFQSEL